jgi:ParB-like chromosome segregation protein Spo0J
MQGLNETDSQKINGLHLKLAMSNDKSKHTPKRSSFQREKDLETITALYLRGHTQQQIADQFNLSRQQIGYDIKEIQSRWRTSEVFDFNEAKQRELAQIDQVEREAWAEWERSKTKKLSKSKKIKTGTDEKNGSFNEEAEETKEENLLGDPRYLQIVNECRKDRMKLLGIGIEKVDLTSGGKSFIVTIGQSSDNND